MTNLLAAIITTISTNWSQIAEWHPLPSGQVKIIEQATLQTNVTAVITWKGHKTFVPLEISYGPIVGERRIDKPPQVWPWGVESRSFTIPLITNDLFVIRTNGALSNP